MDDKNAFSGTGIALADIRVEGGVDRILFIPQRGDRQRPRGLVADDHVSVFIEDFKALGLMLPGHFSKLIPGREFVNMFGGKKISRLSWLPGKVMYHEIKQVIGARLYWCPARNGPKIKEMI